MNNALWIRFYFVVLPSENQFINIINNLKFTIMADKKIKNQQEELKDEQLNEVSGGKKREDILKDILKKH